MVDKIDKTTLKILLFIVFLVILYLIVNRKKQIKEGFADLTNEEKIKAYIGGLVKIFKEGKASITKNSVYRKKSGRSCLSVGNQSKAKADALTELEKRITTLKVKDLENDLDGAQSTHTRFIDKQKNLINEIAEVLYAGLTEDDSKIINSTTLVDNRKESGWVKSSAHSDDGGCRGFAYIKSITYNGETCNNDDELWGAIEKEATTASTAIDNTAEAEAEAAEAAVTTLNNKKKEVIQSYLDLLDDNGITLKDVDTIISDEFTDEDDLKQTLYTAMKDYYNSVISTHKLTETETESCSDVGKTDLSLKDCQAFRKLYVPTSEESSESNFGTYPGISKMTTGTFYSTKEKDYVKSSADWDWLSKGCQYRHKEDTDPKNGLYHKENTASKSVFALHNQAIDRRQLTLLCKEKEEEYNPSINPIADAVTALLNRKKAISIGKQYLNIFKKIIEGYDFGKDTTIFEKIIEELKIYHKIEKKDMANLDDTEFIYPNCEAKNMISLNKKECSNFRKEYVSDTITPKETKHGSMLTDNTNGNFKQENGYMRLGDSAGNWMPKGCSYRAGGGDKGIHYSDNDPDYRLKNPSSVWDGAKYSHISKFDLFCKINKININNLTTLSNLITKKNNTNLKNILTSILKLLDTENPLTDNKIDGEITKLQRYVDTHIENEKKKLTSKERITLENSFNLI